VLKVAPSFGMAHDSLISLPCLPDTEPCQLLIRKRQSRKEVGAAGITLCLLCMHALCLLSVSLAMLY
jgi:hypothetical protein